MGLVESTLKAQTVRSLVRPDSITPLPSLALDSCKFTDGSFGFLVTTVDLAKNTMSYSIPIKDLFSYSENVLVYVGKDESTVTFAKDRLSGRVYVTLHKQGAPSSIVRQCVAIYEPLENEQIDRIATLY
jgi:hypothetical protein